MALVRRKHQIEGLEFILNNQRLGALLWHEMGLGKAQPLDAIVVTPTGPKKMGDILVGETVIGMDGTPKKVMGVYPQGLKKILRFNFTDGSHTECCEDHLWSVRTSGQKFRGNGFKVKKASELIGDLVDTANNWKWEIPITQKVQYASRTHVIPPYTLGVLIGDGSIGNGHLAVTNASEHIFRRMEKEILLDFDLKITRTDDSKNNSYIIRIVREASHGDNRFTNEIRKLELAVTSRGKFIPDEYKYSSTQVREALLSGLLDTDGYVAKDGTIQYTSASFLLVEDVREIAQSLGCVVAPTTCKVTNIGTDAYTCTIKLSADIDVVSKPEKKARLKKVIKYPPCRKITSIQFAGYKEAQCISVEEQHYLTNEYIVTHNTLTSLDAVRIILGHLRAHGAVNPKFLVVAPKSASSTWRKECLDNARDLYQSMVMLPFSRLHEQAQLLTHQDIRVIICDESHYLKNPESERMIRFAKMLEAIQGRNGGFQGGKIIFLSGTPMLNHAGELFSSWCILTSPNLIEASKRVLDPLNYGNWNAAFSKQKKKVIKFRFGEEERHSREGVQNSDKMIELLAPIAHRRRSKECLDMPEKNIIPIDLGLPDDKLLKDADIEKPEAYMAILERLARAKAPHMMEWVNEFLKNTDKQLVLFSMYLEPIYALQAKHPKEVVIITGDETDRERQASVLKFQQGKVRVIAMSYQTGSESLNLQNAYDSLYLGYPWTDGKLKQAIARTWRQGQGMTSNHFVLCSGENDTNIMWLVRAKEEATNEVENSLLLYEQREKLIEKIAHVKEDLGDLF